MLDRNEKKPFDCFETIAIFVCKQISYGSFKNKITYKLFIYKGYMNSHLTVCKQITDVKSNCSCYMAIFETI